MKKNLKKIMAVILAAIVVMTTFAACSKNKDEGEGAPADETVNATENSTEPTSEEGWSENTSKKEDENTSAQSSDSTTKKNETTKASSSNGSQTTTKKPVTTTKKQETTTKKPVTTTKPSKPTTTKPPQTTTKPPQTTKPSSPYLTQAQKNQVINYYRDAKKHGAPSDYKVIIGTAEENGVGYFPSNAFHTDFTQDNFERYMERRYNDWSWAPKTHTLYCRWEEKDGKSTFWYAEMTN